MRRIAVVGMIILGLVAVPLIAAAKPAPEKTEICHVTGDGGTHTITVSEKALPAHLAHGDEELACVDPAGTTPDTTPPPNQAPTATITYSYSCDDSGPFVQCRDEFDGASSSDPEGSDLIYFWTVNGPYGSTNFNSPILSIPEDPNISFTVTLVVSDGQLLSEPAVWYIEAG